MSRRAIGIVRVSERKGREGDSFTSPAVQGDRIRAECDRLDLDLAELLDEVDVSGRLALERRRGLGPAVAAIEAGEAEVLIVAYFDRLVRNIGVQQEVIDRVESAGGAVLTVDFGQVSHATATQWLTASQMGLVNDYVSRMARERSGEAQARAVARGVVPWPTIPPGYVRGEDGVLAVDEQAAPAVREAFAMRGRGETVKAIRAYLRGHGIERSFHGVSSMLQSRLYLGEIHFGKLVNLDAHEPLIELEAWRAAQATTRGARPASEHLLARLGVLRCDTCGARMVAGSSHHGTYPIYRCPSTGDCPRRVAISAKLVEGEVVEVVKAALRDVEGRASADTRAREAEAAAERAQADLDAAIRTFAGLEDEVSAIERLTELRAKRDEARSVAHELGGLSVGRTVSADDWDRLTTAEQRATIAAVLREVRVRPGRTDRLRFEVVGQ